MANVIASKLNALYHRGSNHAIAAGGVFTAANTNRIFYWDFDAQAYKSYRPNRTVNGFSSLLAGDVGRTYLIDAISNITWNSDSQIPVWVADDGDEDLSPTVLADDVSPWVWNHHSDKVPNFGEFSGTQRNSSQSGNASDSATWGGSALGAGHVVRINSGHTVTWDLNASTAYKCIVVQNGGTLTFKYDADTMCVFQHFLVRETGTLNTGTVANPIGESFVCRLIVDNVALDTTNDPSQFGNGMVILGTWRAVGYARGLSYAQLTANANDTDTTVTVPSAGLNWKVGDRLFFTDTRFAPTTGQHHETAEIASLSEAAGVLTITLTAGLTYDHHGQVNDSSSQVTWPHVMNLTQNVTVESEDATGVPGHAVAIGRADIRIKNVCFVEMGRTAGDENINNTVYSGETATSIGTNQIGKYPMHLHHVGGRTAYGAGYAWEIENCTVDGGDDETHVRKWGFTVHGSHYGYLSGCSVYNAFGGGFVFEDGSETANVVQNCFAAHIRGLGDREISDSESTGFARNGTGFWMRACRSKFSNIVASNCQIYGLIVNSISAGTFTNIPTYQGSMHSVDVVSAPAYTSNVGHFDGFKTYGTHAGFTFWWFGSPPAFSTYIMRTGPRFVFKNVTTWNVYPYACWYYEGARVDLDGLQVYCDHARMFVTGNASEGLRMGDYLHSQMRVMNSTIHGVTVGLADQRCYVNNIVVENTEIRAGIGIEVAACSAAGSMGNESSALQRPRRLTVRNCDLVPTAQSVNLSALEAAAQHKQELRMNVGASATNDNYAVQKDVYIYDRNGNVGESYRVYPNIAAPDSDYFPLTTSATFGAVGVIGRPASETGSITQAGMWEKYEPYDWNQTIGGAITFTVKSDNPNPNTPGLAFWGAVAPAGAYQDQDITWDGYLEDI
jgi:hypothetical protein